jgi:hypothetical protein
MKVGWIAMPELQSIGDRLHPRFQPFTISTSDGRSLDVRKYESIAIGRRVVSVIGSDDSGHHLTAEQIAAVSDLSPDGN